MDKFHKNYIGKGKKDAKFNAISITLPFDELEQYVYEKEGTRYLTFKVAELQTPDKFDRTHTVYVNTKLAETVQEPAETPKAPEKKSRKRAQ